ncbi:hypothetical protein AWJ20_2447 [Sugiyamaella lignohabitans]|uniref:Uncharacterized protein n=1 Tax=Sugiyamaella lignohabitans TaxID=796027 RepID=A0A167F4Y6_9ASCO|nr:uncharacterized protein AWJ20_2447 [Sugiyamaella lignohabitans]ANB14834.1 hypothetical protein AWJ20_2447 [Sugiyamaella lignohabitans]
MAVLRQPPRTPVRRVASGASATNGLGTPSAKHRTFNDDDDFELGASKTNENEEDLEQPDDGTSNDKNNSEAEEDSDSDEAPEEESNSSAAQQLRQRTIERERLQAEEVAREKARRRERDLWLKQQKEKALSSLLPDSVFEELEEEQAKKETSSSSNTITSNNSILNPKKPQHIKLDGSVAKKTPKKTLYKKGPVLVKVLGQAKKLAPQRENVVSQTRDSFLNRKSIHRR